MRLQTTRSNQSVLLRFIKATFMAGLLPALVLLFSVQSNLAGSATWNQNPTSGDWNTAANWTPATVPNGPDDTATFDASNTTNVFLSTYTQVDGIVFNPGASPYTINVVSSYLDIYGLGISNNLGGAQSFVNAGRHGISFYNTATAGYGTIIITNTGSKTGLEGGFVSFWDESTAGAATIINLGADDNQAGPGGQTYFNDGTSAGNGTFICTGSTAAAAFAGSVIFAPGSTAANGTFTINGSTVKGGLGGYMVVNAARAGTATITLNGATVAHGGRALLSFLDGADAEKATLIANGGSGGGRGGAISFQGTSRGEKARVELFDDGSLDLSEHDSPGLVIGSIEGNGPVNLGRRELTIGSNNLNTIFDGVIRDLEGGSLIKAGTGKLELRAANNYTGGTTIDNGELVINNVSGSGLGRGPVQVNRGRLGGRGRLSGAVILGTGSESGAVLAPGKNRTSIGVLTILNSIIFNSESSYDFQLDSSTATSDTVTVSGVTLESGALFLATDVASSTMALGTTFTAVNNTSPLAIAGTFANLPDGSTITIGNNTFQANYEGGDGNDLTLTVVQ